ncbi:Ras association domain protein [Necator americanus]|uniref:Ras association domain protein n=1 Tax=Necator americanus TaxID=51031 RepID=W2TGG8_NECAM|nr:Ras association domain protein [Necator americanus]ETN80251.1 Ras association domain protein [Necator americanus]
MELKVSVDGVERSISGVSNETTCAQIIYALAHAISQKGRFVMVEKYRNKERRLSPVDKPLELLEKWREHMSNVTFVLKKIEDENDKNSSLNASSSKALDFPTGSSAVTVQSISSSSMPSALPSDYNSVMEQKFASLGRNMQPNSTVSMLPTGEMSIAKMGLTQNDLLVLIEKQRQMIERQRENLLNTELTLPSEADRELLQLQLQQENLRSILAPMRESNWPQQYQKQLKQSHKLRAAIEATREAIDKTMSDINRMRKEEEELQKKLADLEGSIPTSQQSSIPMNSSSSSKLKAC